MSWHNRALRDPQMLRAFSIVLCLTCLVPAGASAEKAREATAKPVAPAAAGSSTIYIILYHPAEGV
jgi:hypothetical protein